MTRKEERWMYLIGFNNLVSTLECEGLTQLRRDGNTTRQVDFAIQQLFKNKTVVVESHDSAGDSGQANKYLADQIRTRLKLEHMRDASYHSGLSTMILK